MSSCFRKGTGNKVSPPSTAPFVSLVTSGFYRFPGCSTSIAGDCCIELTLIKLLLRRQAKEGCCIEPTLINLLLRRQAKERSLESHQVHITRGMHPHPQHRIRNKSLPTAKKSMHAVVARTIICGRSRMTHAAPTRETPRPAATLPLPPC
jgi:hypothetical protein